MSRLGALAVCGPVWLFGMIACGLSWAALGVLFPEIAVVTSALSGFAGGCVGLGIYWFYGLLRRPLLTEADVRRIVREEIAASKAPPAGQAAETLLDER